MKNKSRIPSDEEFDRVSRAMEEEFRGLDHVRDAIVRRFKTTCPLHTFHLIPQGEFEFEAYVFFDKEEDIETCRISGTIQAIKDCIFSELERAGRGRRADMKVVFVFDSNENVVANYEGDYFLRLR